MKIVALIKQTPDTAELPKVAAEDVRSRNIKATMVINPWDEFAAEEAIALAERFNADTLALSLGTPGEVDALKHALAMGINDAVLVDNSDLGAADLWVTAATLAAAVHAQDDVALVITGKQSVDDSSGSVYVGVATKLAWPLLTNVIRVMDIVDGVLTVERAADGMQERVSVRLPAVISVAKEINEPRYPSFMGIRKASKAKIPTVSPDELGVTVAASQAQWHNIRKPELRKTQVRVMDGASVQEKASKLVDALLAEKVI